MAATDKDERWLFGKAAIYNAPSTQDPDPMDHKRELHFRQITANFIQEMGQKLQVTQLCINTAIVYMHRFYMFQRFQRFNKNHIGAGCLYLAAKIEEQPRKLEHVTKVAYMLQHRDGPLDTKGETYLMLSTELIKNENILLPTLGFDLMVDHPHTHVVKTCQMIKASKDLAQTSYFLATNSLHLTTMCLKYRPTVVACVCIHLASKWGNWELQSSAEGKPWYSYVDKFVTPELLEELTIEFLEVLDGCPTRLKKRIMTWRSGRDKDEDKDKEGPPEKKARSDVRPPSSSTPATSSPALAAKADPSKERAGVSTSDSDRKVRFKLENPVKVVSQSDKTNFPPDSAAAVSGSHSSSATSGLSYSNQKIDQRKKLHKSSSVPRMEVTVNMKVASNTKAPDRHSHMVHHHQNAPLKLTIKAPMAPSDVDAKMSGSSQMSTKWSHQSSNRLKLDNHSGSNLTIKQTHNMKEYVPSDRMKDSNHMSNLKSHSDYLQKQGSSRMPSMDHVMPGGQSTSSKSTLYQNNAYSVMSGVSNDVQYDSPYKIKRSRACPSVHPYKVGPKQHPQTSSQSMRYNSYHQQQPSSDLRMDNDKALSHNLESNGSGPSQAITNLLSTGMSSSATASSAGSVPEQFDELQLQLQQIIDIQKKKYS